MKQQKYLAIEYLPSSTISLAVVFCSTLTSFASGEFISISNTADDFAAGSQNTVSPVTVPLFSFTGLPSPISSGELNVSFLADVGDPSESIRIDADGGAEFSLFYSGVADFVQFDDSQTIPLATLETLLSDGNIDWTVTYVDVADTGPGSSIPQFPQEFITLELNYTAVPEPTSLLLALTAVTVGLSRRRR